MLRSYTCQNDRLVLVEASSPDSGRQNPWSGSICQSDAGRGSSGRTAPRHFGADRDEMEEIELSARLYHEGGAEFMTMTAVTKLDTDEPVKTP